MAILGQAALAVWLECLPEAEDDFNRWYVEQHLAERVGLPGFLRARRYQAVRGAPKYLAFYEAESVDVFRSPAYLERLNNPTDWTRRVMPTVRDFTRGVYRLAHTEDGIEGRQDSQAVITLRLDPTPAEEQALRTRYGEQALKEMARGAGVVSATLFALDRTATGGFSEERKLVGATAVAPPFFCFCEVQGAAIAEGAAWRAVLAAAGPARVDAVQHAVEGVYRLLDALSHSQA